MLKAINPGGMLSSSSSSADISYSFGLTASKVMWLQMKPGPCKQCLSGFVNFSLNFTF